MNKHTAQCGTRFLEGVVAAVRAELWAERCPGVLRTPADEVEAVKLAAMWFELCDALSKPNVDHQTWRRLADYYGRANRLAAEEAEQAESPPGRLVPADAPLPTARLVTMIAQPREFVTTVRTARRSTSPHAYRQRLKAIQYELQRFVHLPDLRPDDLAEIDTWMGGDQFASGDFVCPSGRVFRSDVERDTRAAYEVDAFEEGDTPGTLAPGAAYTLAYLPVAAPLPDADVRVVESAILFSGLGGIDLASGRCFRRGSENGAFRILETALTTDEE